MQRFTIIEGWRAILAWWVVLSHTLSQSNLKLSGKEFNEIFANISVNWTDPSSIANWFGYELWQQAQSGKIPVYIFVMISGFVITHLLSMRHERYDVYIIRRFFRLWPALFFVLCLCAAFYMIDMPLRNYSHVLTDPATGEVLRDPETNRVLREDMFWQHFFLESTMFHGVVPDNVFENATQMISGPGWSISLEWQFYIVAPFMLLAFTKGGWRLWVVAAVLILCAWLGVLHDKKPVIFGTEYKWGPPSFLPHLIGFFALGMLSYFLLKKLKQTERPLTFGALIILSAGLIANSFQGPEGNFLPFVIWAMMFVSIMTSGTVFHYALDNKALSWLGTISYSTYIVHMPILTAVKKFILLNEPLMKSFGYLVTANPGTRRFDNQMEALGYPGVEFGTPQFEAALNEMGLKVLSLGSAEFLILMLVIAWPIVILVSIFSYYVIEKPGIKVGKMIASKLTGKPKSDFPQIKAPA